MYSLNVKFENCSCTLKWQSHWTLAMRKSKSAVHCAEKNAWLDRSSTSPSKTLFTVPTEAHYYKIIEMLKQYKNYNTCSDMFRFTQEPSSVSSPVLS